MKKKSQRENFVMAIVNHNKVLFFIITLICAIKKSDTSEKRQKFQDWYTKVSDQNFLCPIPAEREVLQEQGPILLEIVNCEDPNAIYRYNFKVRSFSPSCRIRLQILLYQLPNT